MANDRQKRHASAIDRRTFLRAGSAAAIGFGTNLGGHGSRAAGQSERPNLLLIMTDQQHFDTIAAGGCPYVQTPALDRLLRSGTHYRISYTSNPLCSPARSSLLTGRMPCETGVHVNGKPIRASIPNLGQWLGEKAGYESAYAGKWHLPRSYDTDLPGFRVLHTGIGGAGYLCDPAVSLACEAFLRNRASSRPFLLFASFMQPHDICEWLRLNLEVPDRLRYPEIADDLPELPPNLEYDRHEPAKLRGKRDGNEPARGNWAPEHWRYYRWGYYRHIEMVDGEIGRILQALDDTGQTDNTLIVFTSDHGEGLGHHQMVRKSSPYDEASRVPFIIARPGRIPAGAKDAEHPVSGVDVMPTFCDYAGIEPPPDMRGVSLRPWLEGRGGQDDRLTVTELNGDAGRMVRTRRFKYIAYVDDPVDQLFDMEGDPGETKNLAGDSDCREIVAEHRAILKEWESRLDVAPSVPKSTAWWRRG